MPHRLRPVLIVDDNPNDRFLIAKMIARTGISNPVLDFADGASVITFLKRAIAGGVPSELPCLIVVDLMMPEMDGAKFTGWVKRQRKLSTTKVVLMSSSGVSADVKRSMAVRADDYLVKYPGPDLFAAIVTGATQKPVL